MAKIPNDYTYSSKKAKELIEKSCEMILSEGYVRQIVFRKQVKAIKVLGSIRISESSLMKFIRLKHVS